MKIYKRCIPLVFIMAVLFSCGNPGGNPEGTAKIVIRPDKGEVFFQWQAVQGTEGYVVQYGKYYDNIPEYGEPLETAETNITISDLDLVEWIYFFKFSTKEGNIIPSMPQNPIVIFFTLLYPSAFGTSDIKTGKPEPFDYETFMEQKAAWETQGFSHYRYKIRPAPVYTRTFYTVTVYPNGKTETADYEGNALTEESLLKRYGRTIEELYDLIMENVADAEAFFEDGHLFKFVKAQYNETYHYPEKYEEFYGSRKGKAGGGNDYSFTIYDFELLQ